MKKLISKWLFGDIIKQYSVDAPFDKVIDTLTEIVKDNSFSALVTHDLKSTYLKKDLQIQEDCEYKIVQICNATKSHKALSKMSFDMGVMMPKSIVVAREKGKTTLRFMKMKLWMVSMMFPELDIAPMSKMVTGIMEKIITETINKVHN